MPIKQNKLKEICPPFLTGRLGGLGARFKSSKCCNWLMWWKNSAKRKNYTIFAPLNSLNNPKWKNKRKREKHREKSCFSAADRSYDLFIFLPPWLKRVKKNWGSDYSQGLKGMVVNKSRPLDSSFFKCRLCWLCWGHLTNQRWGERLGRNRLLLLWKH